MIGLKRQRKQVYLLAALWGVPGLLTLFEAYRLAYLPRYQATRLFEGPVGYMLVIGSLLMGFSLWEIILFSRNKRRKIRLDTSVSMPISKKVWFTLLYMILFLILVPIVGFIVASGCFLAGSLQLLGCSIKAIAVTVLFYCGGLYLIVPYLGLSLHRGILGI